MTEEYDHGDIMRNVSDLRQQHRWFIGICLTSAIALAGLSVAAMSAASSVGSTQRVIQTQASAHEDYMITAMRRLQDERHIAIGETAAGRKELVELIAQVQAATLQRLERHEDRLHTGAPR